MPVAGEVRMAWRTMHTLRVRSLVPLEKTSPIQAGVESDWITSFGDLRFQDC